MRSRLNKRVSLLILTAVLLLAACTVAPGRLRTTSRTVELGGAESARVELQMGAGVLTVGGGADDLMEADFAYNVAHWEPEVSYEVNGSRGELLVRQPEAREIGQLSGDYRYEWELDFREDVPLDIRVALGAGQSTLDLGELTLTAFALDAGVGDCTLDLTGDWDRDLNATISAGVGRLGVQLPQDVGVRVTVSGGLGEVNAAGLQRDGDAYVNEAYGTSDVTLTLEIEGGVGEVDLAVGG
jgi:hypothetical protein